MVVNENSGMEKLVVSAVTHDKNQARITLKKVPDQPGIAAKIFSPIAEQGIVVDMIIQNTRAGGETDLTFTVPQGDYETALELERKVAAGAAFALTQPVYEPERIEETYEKTAHLGVPVLLGVLPPANARNAEFLHHEVPGIRIPEPLRLRLRRAPEGAQREVGEDIGRELIEAARPFAPGFYVIPPFGRVETAARLVEHVRAGVAGP